MVEWSKGEKNKETGDWRRINGGFWNEKLHSIVTLGPQVSWPDTQQQLIIPEECDVLLLVTWEHTR